MSSAHITGVDPAGLPGLTLLLGGRLVVLAPETELAAHYTDHTPAPGQFRCSRPYQQPAPGPPPDQAAHAPCNPATPAPLLPSTPGPANGEPEGPAGHKPSSGVPQGPAHAASSPLGGAAGGVEPHAVAAPVRRKRKRGKAREPNAAEQQVRCCAGYSVKTLYEARIPEASTIWPMLSHEPL